MKAWVQDRYGSPDVLRLEEVARPAPADDEVLVRVLATSLNAADWHYMRGWPYVARMAFGGSKPIPRVRGSDVAGRVESVGSDVKQFQPGDEVFGLATGSFAEYAVAKKTLLAPKPAGLTFEQAAAVPLAAVTALQGLRDAGKLEPGQKVLINGAGGGVGTFAVQIAKALGAIVTAVTSSTKLDVIRSLGADHVIDYGREDFVGSGERYDLMFELGHRSLSDCRRALTPKGTVVICGGSDGRWVDGIGRIAATRITSAFVSQKMLSFLARPNQADLTFLSELVDAGKLKPVIDHAYPLDQAADAMRHLESGRVTGKIVITVS